MAFGRFERTLITFVFCFWIDTVGLLDFGLVFNCSYESVFSMLLHYVSFLYVTRGRFGVRIQLLAVSDICDVTLSTASGTAFM